MKTKSVQSCSKTTPRCRNESGYELVCGAWRSVTKSCHNLRGLLAQQTRVSVPGYVSGPGTFRVSLVRRPPSALTSAQGQRCNLLRRCQCIRSWRCTEDRVARGPLQQRAAHGSFRKIRHRASQNIGGRFTCSVPTRSMFHVWGASVFYSGVG